MKRCAVVTGQVLVKIFLRVPVGEKLSQLAAGLDFPDALHSLLAYTAGDHFPLAAIFVFDDVALVAPERDLARGPGPAVIGDLTAFISVDVSVHAMLRCVVTDFYYRTEVQ